MITDRDQSIIRFLERYKYSNLLNIQKMFFNDGQNYSYNIARRRMGELKKLGYVKAMRDLETNKNIYMWNNEKVKPPSRHRQIVLDVFAEMKYQGYDVELFDIEKQWMDGAIRSDAFVVFNVDKRRYHFFIEVHLSHNPHNLEKYDKLYETGEVQKYLGKDFFPKVLLICDSNYTIKLNHTKYIKLNTKLDQFSSILIQSVGV